MVDLTRRGFLRTASISAAAVGVLGALPSLARADEPNVTPVAGSSVPMPIPTGGQPSLSSPMVVYIDSPLSGKGIIFIGEQGITFDSPGLVESLQSAMA